MAISETYSELILEDVIREILDSGEALSVTEIQARYDARVADLDLSEPQFSPDDTKVEPLEYSSATKWNLATTKISQDLRVAYSELFKLTDGSTTNLDRWRTETAILESELKKLEARITDLTRNLRTAGTKYITDDFIDTSLIDLTETTAYVNLKDQTVLMELTDSNPTKISLNYIQPKDIQFLVLSKSALQATVTAPGTALINAFDDRSTFWQTRVITSAATKAVSCELKIKISSTAISLTKISIKLHSANANSSVQVTPLLSVDGINFLQVPADNITLSLTDKGNWTFLATDVTHIKFIMTKTGYDSVDNGSYVYEFGAEDISFYTESFSDDSKILVSQVMSVLDIDKQPVEFNAIELSACERLPVDTGINYFVAALPASDSTPTWNAIDHMDKIKGLHPKIIKFGDINNVTLTDIKVSYDPAGDPLFINPANDFTQVAVSGDTATESDATSGVTPRYHIVNSNDRILDHQLSLDNYNSLIPGSLEIFRNVGLQNTSLADYIDEVREVRQGWRYEDPYYITTIDVISSNGFTANFGDKAIILDNAEVKGKLTIPLGIHVVKIHKNSWINIPGELTTMADVMSNDPLFPFNHKHLIEGYGLDDTANPYSGVVTFAEIYMKQVSVADFISNVSKDDYTRFATDLDNGSTDVADASLVFMVKSDESQSDFLDELFEIRFDLKNQLYKYVKFKAELFTTDTSVSPNLDGYKLKLSRG